MIDPRGKHEAPRRNFEAPRRQLEGQNPFYPVVYARWGTLRHQYGGTRRADEGLFWETQKRSTDELGHCLKLTAGADGFSSLREDRRPLDRGLREEMGAG